MIFTQVYDYAVVDSQKRIELIPLNICVDVSSSSNHSHCGCDWRLTSFLSVEH